jgi:hypothetical protein
MSGAMAGRLAEAFEYSAVFFLELTDTGGQLTDEEGRNVDTFRALEESVKDIPAALLEDTAQLAEKYPDEFERWLYGLIGRVSDQYRPATAAEFVAKLNSHVQRVAAS